MVPIGPSEYFDTLPSLDHRPGDIWDKLPTLGTNTVPIIPGLVITPACDLANRKVETVTYLPIVSVRSYLVSRSLLPEILRATDGQLCAGGMQIALRGQWDPSFPNHSDIEAAQTLLNQELSSSTLGDRQRQALSRAAAGLRVISDLLRGQATPDHASSVRRLFGDKDYRELIRRILTNAYRPDIHFLPIDAQPKQWSTITEHSVTLFRYPLTLPLDLLDLANSASADSWHVELTRFKDIYPCSVHMSSPRPVKTLSVRPRFLADILSRFVGLYGRIGSPDFTQETVNRYLADIETLS